MAASVTDGIFARFRSRLPETVYICNCQSEEEEPEAYRALARIAQSNRRRLLPDPAGRLVAAERRNIAVRAADGMHLNETGEPRP